jgi:3-oxoacyl-[acyl-carrier-protein] synthase-3
MNQVRMIGVAEHLPGPPVTNEDLERHFSIRADWIDLTIGTRARHFLIDLESKQPRGSLASLCVEAGARALSAAQVSADMVDVVVLSTATPDHLMPATVNLACEALGIDEVATYQIQSGCAGAIQALQIASSLLLARSGGTALVLSADSAYKFFDFTRDFSKLPPSELINIALFGDGAGACVLTTSNERDGLVLGRTINRLEGKGSKPGHLLNWQAPRGPQALEQGASEDYKAIEERVPRMTREALAELLAATGLKLGDVRYFLPPQLAGHISEKIITRLELDRDRCISRVAEVGNTGNATPYFQLTRLMESMQGGEHALLLAIESSKWIKTGLHLWKE